MRRLGKRHVEALLARYDDDPTGALAEALAVVLGTSGSFPELVALAPLPPERRAALLTGDLDALDEFAAELNERRTLAP